MKLPFHAQSSNTDDEALLIRRAQQGDQEAFAEIYQRHYDAVYTYLFYRLDDQLTAEDLTGEVFLRMVDKISSYSHRGRPILAWLYTIARNLANDYYRHSSFTMSQQSSPLDEQPLIAPHNTEDTVERRLTQECLRRALHRLNETYRQVIILRFIQGLSHAETAAILGKTPGNTKVLQHRALKALRRAFDEEGCYEP